MSYHTLLQRIAADQEEAMGQFTFEKCSRVAQLLILYRPGHSLLRVVPAAFVHACVRPGKRVCRRGRRCCFGLMGLNDARASRECRRQKPLEFVLEVLEDNFVSGLQLCLDVENSAS